MAAGDVEVKLYPILTLRRGFTLRCGICGSRGLIRRWFGTVDECPRCGLRLQRLAGHELGAIGFNTIASFGALFVFLIVGTFSTMPDVPVRPLVIGGLAIAILVPILLQPFSHTVFLAADLLARPPLRTEFDADVPGVHLPQRSA